jgi:hypothetical protein
MTHFSVPLRHRIEDAYAAFLDAFDHAARSSTPQRSEALLDATDRLMRALAQVVIEASGQARDDAEQR